MAMHDCIYCRKLGFGLKRIKKTNWWICQECFDNISDKEGYFQAIGDARRVWAPQKVELESEEEAEAED